MSKRLPQGLKHAFWSLLDTAIYPVFYLATVPIMLHYLGATLFGFWILINTIITILQVFNFNLGYTALIRISHAQGKGLLSRVSELINALLKITFLQWLALIAMGSLAAVIIGRTRYLDSYSIPIHQASLCVFWAAILAGLKYLEQLFQNIIKAYDQFRTAAILNMISRFGSLGISLLLAATYHADILVILVGNVAFSITYLIIHFLVINKVLPFYKPSIKTVPGLEKQLIAFSMWPWIQSILVILTFQGDRLWVSTFSGLKTLALYGLVATMFNHIHMIFMAMVTWVFPRLIRMEAQQKNSYEWYQQISGLFTCISIGLLLLFYFSSPFLIRTWLGNENYGQMKYFIRAFTVFEILYVHTILPFYLLNGTGSEKKATIFTFGYCALCYVLMLGAMYGMGRPEALVEGMALSMVISVPVLQELVNRQYGQGLKYWDLFLGILPSFLCMALVYTNVLWLQILFLIGAGFLFWRYHLSSFFNSGLWKQFFRGTITSG